MWPWIVPAQVNDARAVSVVNAAAGAGAEGAAAGVVAAETAARASKVMLERLAAVKRWVPGSPARRFIPLSRRATRAATEAKNHARPATGMSTTERAKAAGNPSGLSHRVMGAANGTKRVKAANVTRVAGSTKVVDIARAVSATTRRASPRRSRVLPSRLRHRRSSRLLTRNRAASAALTPSPTALPKGARGRTSRMSSGPRRRRTRSRPVGHRTNRSVGSCSGRPASA
jgi:hypothetical protein